MNPVSLAHSKADSARILTDTTKLRFLVIFNDNVSTEKMVSVEYSRVDYEWKTGKA
jgi:hypothetical protein